MALKSSLGEGYIANVSFVPDEKEKTSHVAETELLQQIRTIAPLAYTSSTSPNAVSYHLKLKDPATVQRVLELVESGREQYGVANLCIVYSVPHRPCCQLPEIRGLSRSDESIPRPECIVA